MNKKGIMNSIISFVVFVIVAGAVVAFFRVNNITSAEEAWLYFKGKADRAQECYKENGTCIAIPNINSNGNNNNFSPNTENYVTNNDESNFLSDDDLRYKGPAFGDAFMQNTSKIKKSVSENILSQVDKVKKYNDSKFVQSDWGLWAPINTSSCWTSKKEAIAIQAVPDSLIYNDINHKETKDKNNACSIVEGEWVDPYSGKKIKDVSEITVDHVVSLKQANKSGGYEWDKETKEKFANDVTDNLLVVSKESYEEKNGKSISEYSPKSKLYQCTYAKNYLNVIEKYDLAINNKDEKSLNKYLSECKK